MIKSIQTFYNGYKFRSRLEARWAVFFDELGVDYRYEPEGFYTPFGRYLPDFYLPQFKAWVEVKGGRLLTDVEQGKLEYVCMTTFSYGMVVCSDPYDSLQNLAIKDIGYMLCSIDANRDVGAFIPQLPLFKFTYKKGKVRVTCSGFFRDNRDQGRDWCRERECDPGGIYHYFNDDLRSAVRCYDLERVDLPDVFGSPSKKYIYEKYWTPPHPFVLEAAQKARQARFEHGETPRAAQGAF